MLYHQQTLLRQFVIFIFFNNQFSHNTGEKISYYTLISPWSIPSNIINWLNLLEMYRKSCGHVDLTLRSYGQIFCLHIPAWKDVWVDYSLWYYVIFILMSHLWLSLLDTFLLSFLRQDYEMHIRTMPSTFESQLYVMKHAKNKNIKCKNGQLPKYYWCSIAVI